MRACAPVTCRNNHILDLPDPTSAMTCSTAPLDRLVSKAGQLYSLPAVAMDVLELTNNPHVDVAALKQCIENDPALTIKVLRVVNSSLFGLSREVSDLSQGLALLGIKPLKLLVLGFSLPEALFDGVAAEILGRYWRHTLVKAVAAREISETLCGQSGDEAFIAGLLQDLGILLLIQALGEPYVRFLEKVHATGGDLAACETESLGFDHTVLTSRLLDEWGLPDAMVQAVSRRVARPERSDGRGRPKATPFALLRDVPPDRPTDGRTACSSPRCWPLPEIIRLAGLVAQLLADGKSEAITELTAVGDGSPGLTRRQLEELVDNLEEKVAGLADVLSLRLPEGRDYRDVLAEAHSQLAQVAAEAAEDLIRHRADRRTPETEDEALPDEFRALSEAVEQIARTDPVPAALGEGREARDEGRGVSGRWSVASGEGRGTREAIRGPALNGQPSPLTPHPSSLTPHPPLVTPQDVDPGLLGRLDAAVSACRQSHCPLTLLLVELDDVDKLMVTRGVEGLNEVRSLLETACRDLEHPDAICLAYRDFGFAVILPDCERQPAVRLANQLLDSVRGSRRGVRGEGTGASSGRREIKGDRRGVNVEGHAVDSFSHPSPLAPLPSHPSGPTLTISVGAATLSVPSKNFPPEDLFEGAQRCLYGSHASGGGVRSIEIF